MAGDIVPGLLETIQKDFKDAYDSSKRIQQVQGLIESGKATYREANDYAIEVGQILSSSFRRNITAGTLPDGQMYYNIANRVLNPTLGNNYELISNAAAQIQKDLNRTADLGLKAQKAPLNQDRIDGLVNRLSSEERFDDAAWLLDEPVVNFSQSVVDDAIQKNVEFHAKAGLSPKIIRTVVGNPCKWCAEIAGTYTYPDVPKDVYRRHERCRCTVEYDPGDARKKNIWTKTWRDVEKNDKIEARQKRAIGNKKGAQKSDVVKSAIRNGTVKDAINKEKQLKHLEGNSDGASYIYGGMDSATTLYEKLKFTGEPILDRNGKWTRKERVLNDEAIGAHFSVDGELVESKSVVIVYSKTGSHLYPGKEN